MDLVHERSAMQGLVLREKREAAGIKGLRNINPGLIRNHFPLTNLTHALFRLFCAMKSLRTHTKITLPS